MTEQTTLAPVFLVGCPRSGTTLLQRLLDAHSGIAVAPETHFVRHFWLRRSSYGDLTDDRNFDRLLGDIAATPAFAEMGLSAEAFRGAAHRVDRSYPALFELLLQSFAERRGVPLVGEKTPNHLLYMPTLEGFFPAARFIHIVRDPRAVVSSWKSVPWSTGSVAGDTAVWRRYLRTSWTQPPRPGALHVVRYELLVRQPEKELDAICRFLGVPFEPAMLAFHQRETETVNLTREPWKRGAVAPIYADAIEQWRLSLCTTEIAEVERRAWPEMRQLGYRRATGTGMRLLWTARRALRRLGRIARTHRAPGA